MASIKTRRSKKVRLNYSEFYGGVYHLQGKPETYLECLVHGLNIQSFDSGRYAEMDDILAHCMFASKKRNNHRSLKLHSSTRGEPVDFDRSVTIDVVALINDNTSAQDPTPSESLTVAKTLISKYGSLFLPSDQALIAHLILRYRLLHSKHSLVKLSKVTFSGCIGAGIEATCFIPAGTLLLTLGGSMAEDPWHGGPGCISVICPKRSGKTIGPICPRLILGPFRFVNHDCSPNSQFTPIPTTYAYMIETIRDIEQSEPITVSYTSDGYYYSQQKCLCATCRPDDAPRSPPRFPQTEAKQTTSKPRRGGARHRRKKIRLAQQLADCLDTNPTQL